MRVVIELSVAADSQAHRYLSSILNLVEQGWHLWEIHDEEGLLGSEWLRDPGSTGLHAGELFKKSIIRSAYPTKLHRQLVRVTARPEGELEFTPGTAARFLGQPLEILLENRHSDGDFLDAAVETLGHEELQEHWRREPAPIRKDSLGGTDQMGSYVRSRAQEFPPPRLLVVRDGGGGGPALKAAEAVSLEALCRTAGVPCWLLAKYEIENYLPESLLTDSVGESQQRLRRVEAWKRLTDVQKDFYDVKNGLREVRSGDPRSALFQGLSTEDAEELATGFGSKVAGLWRRRPIDANDLRKRAGSELDDLLEFLCENL